MPPVYGRYSGKETNVRCLNILARIHSHSARTVAETATSAPEHVRRNRAVTQSNRSEAAAVRVNDSRIAAREEYELSVLNV